MANTIWKKSLIRVGCVSTGQGLSFITSKQDGVDLIELRFDTLYAADIHALERIQPVLRERQNPVLLTLRTKNEGGSMAWKSTERIRLFEKLIPLVDAVDFELANLPMLKSVAKQARKQGRKIILSAHSGTHKITQKRGDQWIEEFCRYRAEIYKIATLVRTRNDLHVLAKLLIDHPKLRLAVMGTGPMSALSRQVLSALGSRLVYGYLDVPAAKGQPSVAELREAGLV